MITEDVRMLTNKQDFPTSVGLAQARPNDQFRLLLFKYVCSILWC